MRSWSNKGQIRLAIYALASGVVAFATLAHVLQSRAQDWPATFTSGMTHCVATGGSCSVCGPGITFGCTSGIPAMVRRCLPAGGCGLQHLEFQLRPAVYLRKRSSNHDQLSNAFDMQLVRRRIAVPKTSLGIERGFRS